MAETDKARCLVCKHWDPRNTPKELRAAQLATCALGPTWEYLPPHAGCERFAPAPPEIAEKRVQWKERADGQPAR